MQFAVAQADGDEEEGWEDSDLEDDDGDSEGQGVSAPNFVFQSSGAPQLHYDPGQPVMIAGRPYLVGGAAELEARAHFSIASCATKCSASSWSPSHCAPCR